MKRLKEEKGITLVALIITIIVLLILAGVAIGTLEQSNIIGKAKDAAVSFNQAKKNEVSDLTKYEEEILKYIPQENELDIKTGYYIHDRREGYTQVWYIQKIEENKINIKYYSIKDNKVDNIVEFGEFSISKENVKKIDVTNYMNGLSIRIEPDYYVFEALGTEGFIKGKYLYVANNTGDANPEYIEAILDENYMLPQ